MDLYNNLYPAVSIILPAYNRAKLIPRAVKSVAAQTYLNWELLIIDDGSQDDTQEMCAGFVNKDKRIKYFFDEHKGLPPSLNRGIELASGNFVTFLGSDDEYLPRHLELRADYMNRHKEIDLLHGGVEIIGNEFIKDKNDLSRLVHLSECIIGGTFFGKTEIFRELNGFKNIPYSEDSEFFERASEKYKIANVDFPTYVYYRNSEDSISNNI